MAFQFSFIQANNNSSVNQSETDIPFNSTTTASSILFAWSLGDTPASGVIDTAGNTNWAFLGSFPLAFSQGFSDLWWCPSNIGGPNTVKAQTNGSGGNQAWAIAEYNSIAGAFKDAFATSVAAGGTTSETVGPVVTSQNGNTLVYLASILNAGSDTIDGFGSFNLDAKEITVNNYVLIAASMLAGAAGNYSAGLTTSGGRLWVNYLITLATQSGHSISGNAGAADATVNYSGTASGSATADGSGNYTIPTLADGPYAITPSLANFIFSPASQNVTISGSDIFDMNFTAAQIHGWSPVDCRNYATFPNFGVAQPDGSVFYVGQNSCNEHIPTPTSNPNLPPTDSRVAEPENSRVDPTTVTPD